MDADYSRQTNHRAAEWAGAGLLLLVTVVAVGVLIPWLGFYWDDWAKILVSRLWGLGGYPAYYAEDRPLSAWTHMLFTPLLGEGPLGWHLFTLALRWLSGWAAWWTFNAVWPRARAQNLTAALLFVVYPVFTQHAAAVTFHQQWLQYALILLSFGAMARAFRAAQFHRATQFHRARAGWTALALLASLLQLSVTEYFAPLELARPVILWILAGQFDPTRPADRQPNRLARALSAYLPYLLLIALYVVWRLFFLRLPGADPYRAETLYAFAADPAGTLRALLPVIGDDLVRVLVTSWADALYLQVSQAAPFTLAGYALAGLAGLVTAWALARLCRSLPGEQAGWARDAALLGAALLLLGPVPAWITGRQVVFDFHSDRYAMPAMLGAGLLLAAAVDWLAKPRVQRGVMVGVLVALALTVHLKAANDYRWIWTSQTRAFWQLSWRAPGLQAPTALMMEREPFPNQGLFSTSAALNLLYPQPENLPGDPAHPNLGYWLYALRPRYEAGLPESGRIRFNTTFRTLHFEGATPDMLVLHSDPRYGSCLWALSPRDAAHPYLPELVRSAAALSNPGVILPDSTPGYPPEDLFGREPARTSWCYYFEKADLARQFGDWQTAARLGDEALAQGYWPGKAEAKSPYEWLPFIEGYLRAGLAADAEPISLAAFERDRAYGGMLCDVWQGEESELGARTRSALGCASAGN